MLLFMSELGEGWTHGSMTNVMHFSVANARGH